MQFLKSLPYFFPFRLLVLHVKHHLVLLLIWLWLWFIIAGSFGKTHGISFLFLDPEYVGEVNFLSFFLVGLTLGGFLITWNITTYVLNSHRFPFMATLKRPFAMFSLNNSILPVFFIASYSFYIFVFQINNEFRGEENAIYFILSLLLGIVASLMLSSLYFYFTNKNVFQLFGFRMPKDSPLRKLTKTKAQKWEDLQQTSNIMKVDYFITSTFKIRHTRSVEHYDDNILKRVFKQHHFNALVIQLVSIFLLAALGVLIDYEAFRIPAAASIFLLFALLMSLSGVFSFWMGSWKTALFIFLLVGLNQVSKYDLFIFDNRAYGLDYNIPPAEYSLAKLKGMAEYENMQADIRHNEQILNNWKEKLGKEKPRMIVMSISGGGNSAAMFTYRILQKADSLMDNQLFNYTTMITGASGGMFGAAQAREMYLQQTLGNIDDFHDPAYSFNVAEDLLTPLIFTSVVNDLFYPWQKFEWGGHTYHKDRGFVFEESFLRNNGYYLDKRLDEYLEYEAQAVIPKMIITPTIINDGRKLLISPQPVRYLMRPVLNRGQIDNFVVDAVDFKNLFEEQGGGNLRFISAVRMNGTYPYILPNVSLPTSPQTEVMDAGFRDNFGLQLATRYVHAMKNWINEHTGGVIFVQIRAFKHEDDFGSFGRPTFLSRMFTPVGNLYSNLSKEHDYNNAFMYQFVKDVLDVPTDLINFNYIPGKKEERVALSLRLTTKEKYDILESVENLENQQALRRLRELIQK
ncbi:MAG: patatin-like phospholipase family protein [Chitinophagaceae bacterium]|nr:MAG: patatin-like phospholipase family protein [Chitinophagaceae bacterium]